MDAVPESVTFAVPGDIHLTSRSEVNFAVTIKLLKEINQLIRPDFVQFIGDNVQDATDDQFRLFDELRGLLSVRHFALVGDHDVAGDPQGRAFRRWIGEPYGSEVIRGIRFLRLNTLDVPRLGFSDEQLEWLNSELAAAQQQNERVVVFQHHYPYKVCEEFKGPGIDQWRELIQFYRPLAVICGHTHYGQTANDGRILTTTVRSIGDPEGGAPGYLLVHLDKEDFAFTYRTVDATGPLLLITHPRDILLAMDEQHIVHGQDEVRVRIWSDTPIKSVLAMIDDGPVFELSQVEPVCWGGPLPGEDLCKGEHVVKVVAKQEDERRCEAQLRFFVDATRRFTAVPAAWPTVRTTAFC